MNETVPMAHAPAQDPLSPAAPAARSYTRLRRWHSGSGLRLFACVAVVVVALEQFAKVAVRASLPLGASVPVVGDVVRLTHVENPGVAFGLLATWPLVPVVATALILPGLALYVARAGTLPQTRLVTLGAIAGGALGNLVDRLLEGHVTDFVDVGLGNYRWPSFNGADTAIVLGVGALLLFAGRSDHRDAPSPVAAPLDAAAREAR